MGYKIIAAGEVLFDIFPEYKSLGGAPFNFAVHASTLGADTTIFSAVGNDCGGDEIVEHLNANGMNSSLIFRSTYPTGQVIIELNNGKPDYSISDDSAWDHLPFSTAMQQAASTADAVYFGTLAQRSEESRNSILKLLNLAPAGCLKVLDINLRKNFYSAEIIENSLILANVLKLSDEELPIVAGLLNLSVEPETFMHEINKKYKVHTVALTCGSNGSMILTENKLYVHSGIKTQCKDTVGAGDSFTAALTIGLLKKLHIEEINESANKIAAFVCSQAGAIPVIPDKLHFKQ